MNRSTFIDGAAAGAVIISGLAMLLDLDKKSVLICAAIGSIALVALDRSFPDKKNK